MKRAGLDGKLMWLAELPLFETCGRRELERIGRVTDRCIMPAGHVLASRGGTAREFVIVAAGKADVLVDGAAVASIGPGAWVGERELLTQSRYPFDVVAASPMTAFFVDARAFSRLLHDVPSIAVTLLTTLAARLPVSNGSTASISNASPRAQLPAREPVDESKGRERKPLSVSVLSAANH